jgi:hypothetical protein
MKVAEASLLERMRTDDWILAAGNGRFQKHLEELSTDRTAKFSRK